MYKNILFPIDITEQSSWKYSLPVALDHAHAFKAKLYVMTVISDYGMSIVQQYFSTDAVNDVLEKAKADIHTFGEKHIPDDVEVQYIVAKGSVYESIIETAKTVHADLIIMSAHRPELKDYLLGPNAAKVVRHSDRSVLVVREK